MHSQYPGIPSFIQSITMKPSQRAPKTQNSNLQLMLRAKGRIPLILISSG